MERVRRNKDAIAINARRRARRTPRRYKSQHLAKYGMTLASYQQILERQGYACAVCQLPASQYHVDLDHDCCSTKLRCCGKCVRGLLCNHCNLGLGQFKDDPGRLRRAAEYVMAAAWADRIPAEPPATIPGARGSEDAMWADIAAAGGTS